MKKTIVSTLAPIALFAVAMPAPAQAQTDYPSMTWTGFYIGIHGGCGWSGSPRPKNFAVDPNEIDEPYRFTHDNGRGCFGGAQLGYNHQFANNFLLGIEADGSFGKIRSNFAWNQPPDGTGDVNQWQSRTKTFGSVRGRVGYAIDRLLPYFTGGLALGRNRLTTVCPQSCDSFGDLAKSSGTRNHLGWVLGAGLEYAVSNNWSIKAEYQHARLGSKFYNIQVDFDDGVSSGLSSGRLRLDTVRLGLNYRFAPPPPPPPAPPPPPPPPPPAATQTCPDGSVILATDACPPPPPPPPPAPAPTPGERG